MKSILVFACVLLTTNFLFAGGPNELLDPPVFSSSNGILDVLITAKIKTITLDKYTPASWVYEICYRKDATNNTCPTGSRTASPYGGPRLQLNPGDHLKIRFINQLPVAPPDARHAQAMPEMLGANPTNLHTHGLIVEPREATKSDPTFGDYIFVLSYPKGKLPEMQMPGFYYTDKPLDYDIYIPPNHPSGLFWLHPHVHGLALNQITYGLAGIITIGSVGDILANDSSATALPIPRVRHLTLKDMQVLANSAVSSELPPRFCDVEPDPKEAPRNGFCPGIDSTDQDGGGNFIGGKWIFSINGQEYPTITLAGGGEIWRITQASGNRTYKLSIDDDVSGQSLPFQVLAIDGIAIDGSVDLSSLAKSVAGKFTPMPCRNNLSSGGTTPVCATSMLMMPSSRVEIYVPPPGNSASATLLTQSYATGGSFEGDTWPYIRLAHVVFPSGATGSWRALNVKGASARMLSPAGILAGDVKIDGGANGTGVTLQSAPKLAEQLSPEAGKILKEHLAALSAPSAVPSPPCVALPKNHHRRIFFGHDTTKEATFGLGYEEVDQYGRPVPGTFRDIAEFDHSVIDVCLPLNPGNTTVNETWELVNVAGEDHNFHIHQTKFAVYTEPAFPGALVDNVPLPHGTGACNSTVAQWRNGSCKVQTVFAYIPFSEVGDFVYHCHILEHEDGGMMAHIRVVPNP